MPRPGLCKEVLRMVEETREEGRWVGGMNE